MTDDLDETLEETFPASDAPANTPETGIGVNGDHDAPPVPEKQEQTPTPEKLGIKNLESGIRDASRGVSPNS